MEYDAVLNLVDTCDGVTFLVFLRITSADEHHTYCGTFVKLYSALVKVAAGHTFKQVNDVTFQSQHHALRLRVAHTAVVFYHHWLIIYVDEAEEDESLVGDALFRQSFDSGAYDAFFHLLHPFFSGKRDRCNAAHATGIQTCITLTDALVVLCLRQNLIVLAVCEDEYRTLYTAEVFLNDHLCRCASEHSSEHLFQFFLGFVERRQYQHTLAGTQSVGLEYVWSLQGLEELQALFERVSVECPVSCSRDIVTLHESFGKVLAAFEHGTGL